MTNIETVRQFIEGNTTYKLEAHEGEIDHQQMLESVTTKKHFRPSKKYSITFLEPITKRSGVYMFFDESGQLIYVGKTAYLRDRIRQHLQSTSTSNTKHIKHLFNTVAYVQCIEYEARQLERLLIDAYKPYGNVR